MIGRALVLTALATAPAHAATPAEEVPVLASAVDKGMILSDADFIVEERPAYQARGAIAVDQAVGMETRRRLSAGSPVRRGDLIEPQLIRRGEPVRLIVSEGALVITAQGRALENGAKGDFVRVVNSATSRTVEGVVTGQGDVRVAGR